MNHTKIIECRDKLDSAICKIDTLLRSYPMVTKIDIARRARIELEIASKIINHELDTNIETDSSGDSDERSVNDSKSNSEDGSTDNEVSSTDNDDSKGSEAPSESRDSI